MGDVEVDFQSLKLGLRDAFTELQDLINEEGPPDWSALLRTDVDVEGLTSEMAGVITQVRDQFQAGIVEAFELGGAPAAQHFADSFLPQLLELGMTPAQAYELLGLPADGSVQAIIDVQVDIAARDRAKQILDAIAGVDPGNPLIAALQVALVQDNIDPELVEIAALVAAHEMGIPVDLTPFTPEQLAAAQAVLDNANFVAPVTVDTSKAEKDTQAFREDQKAEQLPITAKAVTSNATRDLERVRAKPRVADIKANPTNVRESDKTLNNTAKPGGAPRTAPINTNVLLALVMNALLDHVARTRTADINTELHGWQLAESILNQISRDRTADVFVRTHNVGGSAANPFGAAPAPVAAAVGPLGGPAPLTATSTPTLVGAVATGGGEVHHHYHTSVNAGVVGNRFQLDRIIGDSMRRQSRLAGSRQAMRAKV
jgi:hypothetical protein